MTILAFILILGLLFLVYRKITRAIIPLVPIVMLVGWNGLILYPLGIDYTPMTTTLGSLAIGVAAEYTIVMNERANEELDKGLPSSELSVRALSRSVQQSRSPVSQRSAVLRF